MIGPLAGNDIETSASPASEQKLGGAFLELSIFANPSTLLAFTTEN